MFSVHVVSEFLCFRRCGTWLYLRSTVVHLEVPFKWSANFLKGQSGNAFDIMLLTRKLWFVSKIFTRKCIRSTMEHIAIARLGNFERLPLKASAFSQTISVQHTIDIINIQMDVISIRKLCIPLPTAVCCPGDPSVQISIDTTLWGWTDECTNRRRPRYNNLDPQSRQGKPTLEYGIV